MIRNHRNLAIPAILGAFILSTPLAFAQAQKPAANSAPSASTEGINIRELTPSLASPDAKLKEKTLDQILASSYRDPGLVPQILPLLKDSASPVRALSVRLLGELNDRKVAPEILALCKDPVARVRQESARSLALLEAREAIPDLTALLNDDNEDVAIEAVVGLQHFADERSVKGLTDVMVNGQSYRLRSAAIKALGDIRSSQPVSQLIVLLEYERDVWLRLDIARTLAKIGDDEALKPVMRYLDEVRQEANKQTDKRRKKVYSDIADEVEKLVAQIRKPSSSASGKIPHLEEPAAVTQEKPKVTAPPASEKPQAPVVAEKPAAPVKEIIEDSEAPPTPAPQVEEPTPIPAKPKAPAKPKQTKKMIAPKKSAAAKFTIQIKATKNTDLAHAMVEDLKVKGEEAFITEFQEGTETWYRVRIGAYDKREDALAHAQELKDKKLLEEFFITK